MILFSLLFGLWVEFRKILLKWNSCIFKSNPSIWTVYERSLTYIWFLYPKSYFGRKSILLCVAVSWSLELSLTHNPNKNIIKQAIPEFMYSHSAFRLILDIKTPLFNFCPNNILIWKITKKNIRRRLIFHLRNISLVYPQFLKIFWS